MMKRIQTASLGLAMAALLGACGQGANNGAGSDDPIIGGVNSGGKSMQAVGSVGIIGDGVVGNLGQYYMICTATLIDAQTVLTAKHCTIDTQGSLNPVPNSKFVNYYKMGFAVGNAVQPDKVVEAIAAEVSFPWDGGFMGLGNDVGIYHLIAPADGVTPFAVTQKSLATDDVNKIFTSIGYGAQDNLQGLGFEGLNGTRKAGAQHLDALTGQFFQLVFGTFDEFVKWLTTLYGSQVVADNQSVVMDLWNNSPILDGYEVLTGHRTGDVQTCFGDSGSPLLRRNQDTKQNEIFAVLSGGISSLEKACDYGSIYSAMADTTRDFIGTALKYKDPCNVNGALVDTNGSCNGTVATRCTGKFEGDRSLSSIDCADLGQTCLSNMAGQVGCFDQGSDPNKDNTDPHPQLKQPGDVQTGVASKMLNKDNPRLKQLAKPAK